MSLSPTTPPEDTPFPVTVVLESGDLGALRRCLRAARAGTAAPTADVDAVTAFYDRLTAAAAWRAHEAGRLTGQSTDAELREHDTVGLGDATAWDELDDLDDAGATVGDASGDDDSSDLEALGAADTATLDTLLRQTAEQTGRIPGGDEPLTTFRVAAVMLGRDVTVVTDAVLGALSLVCAEVTPLGHTAEMQQISTNAERLWCVNAQVTVPAPTPDLAESRVIEALSRLPMHLDDLLSVQRV